MYIARIKLTNFKNYAFGDATFSKGYNLITGKNGQGKTNLLDSIYLLCMTKSYFQFSEKNVVRHSEDFFRVEGIFNESDHDLKVVCKYRSGVKKHFEIDDKGIGKYSDFIGRFPVVMVTPNDIHLIEEGSDERRKFMDITICQHDHLYLKELNQYNKILLQRNSLLKQINRGQASRMDLVDYYAEQLAQLAYNISLKRMAFTAEVSKNYTEIYNHLTDGEEPASCAYLPNVSGSVEEILLMINEDIRKDLILERTSRGVHKDEIEFLLRSLPVKKTGSQGQIKSAIFSAKLAQYQWLRDKKQVLPLLLLDDIFDKLDHDRVGRLLSFIDQPGYGQIFITDTYDERLIGILPNLHKEVAIFKIQSDKILRVNGSQ